PLWSPPQMRWRIDAPRALPLRSAPPTQPLELEKRSVRSEDHDERLALAALADAIAAPVPAGLSISADADPQGSAALKLAKWLGLEVTADGVGNLRLALLALLPNVSGLVLAFAFALRRS